MRVANEKIVDQAPFILGAICFVDYSDTMAFDASAQLRLSA
jgi:hypothetical protein